MAKDHRFYDAAQKHREKFLPLLEIEKEKTDQVIKERLSQWSLRRLQDEGYCLVSLSAFWKQGMLSRDGKRVAVFTTDTEGELGVHRFTAGSHVLVSLFDPSVSGQPMSVGQMYMGTVISYTSTQLRVTFDDEKKMDVENGLWRVDLAYPDVMYRRMREAVELLGTEPETHAEGTKPDVVLRGTQLRDALLRGFDLGSQLEAPQLNRGAFCDDQRIYSWARRYRSETPVVEDGDPQLPLNQTQIRAIAQMLSERVSLVQGPPGTGKTKTIVEAVKLLKKHFDVKLPLLVCTYTNVAVDNLVEGMIKAGLNPLRVGSAGKVKETVVNHWLDHLFNQHALKKHLDDCMEDIEKVKETIQRTEKKDSWPAPALQNRVEKMKRRMYALRTRAASIRETIRYDIVSKADVICTTCASSATMALGVVDFPVVFLDEASMSTEPATLIPLMKGSRHLALIGDHKQLPPVVTSSKAQTGGLGVSLFERLMDEKKTPSIMLDIQYRMHPDLSKFPSAEFYDLSLSDGTRDADGNVFPLLLPPSSQHLSVSETGVRPSVIFLDHVGQEKTKDRSRVNYDEVNIVCNVVSDLLLKNPELSGEDIGIIAPYAAQISLLERTLHTDANRRKQFVEVLGDFRATQVPTIEVKTVDGFEGREKEVIIFSTVRNNAYGQIGFLADRRRLNVGLTRAKRALFIVGSISTLRGAGHETDGQPATRTKASKAWMRYIQFLQERNLVIRVQPLPQSPPPSTHIIYT